MLPQNGCSSDKAVAQAVITDGSCQKNRTSRRSIKLGPSFKLARVPKKIVQCRLPSLPVSASTNPQPTSGRSYPRINAASFTSSSLPKSENGRFSFSAIARATPVAFS